MILSGLVTTIRCLGAWMTQKIRPRLTAALAARAGAAAAAALFTMPASAAVTGRAAAVTGRAAQTEATRVSVTPDGEPAGMFLTQGDCLTAGWEGVDTGLWSGFQCLPEDFLGVVYWQLFVDYEYG